MDPRELKERASALFAKGKFAKAAEAYEAYCKADPRDLQTRLRLGDAWAKDGSRDKAILAYIWAAEGFAHEGFLPRAIAASKLVLELDPAHTGVQRTLAQLYAKKSAAPSRLGRPGAAPAGPPAGAADEVTRAAEAPGTAPGFGDRPDAIDLEAPPPAAARPSRLQAAPPPPPVEPPAGAARPSRLQAPPPAEPAPAPVRPSRLQAPPPPPPVGPSRLQAPPPPPEAEAIEIEVEEGGAEEASIEVEVEEAGGADGAVELDLETPGGEPLQVEGVPLPDPAGLPGELEAPPLELERRPAELEVQPATLEEVLAAELQGAAAIPGPPAPAASPGFALEIVEEAPPPSPRPPPAASPVAARSAVALAPPPPSPLPPGGPSDLELSLQALLDGAAPVAEPVPAPVPGFTELDLDDAESLLQAVAAASPVPASAQEERLEAPEEARPGALPHVPLFSDLPEEAFIALFTHCPLRRFQPGEVILAQGTRGEAFYVVCGGEVKVSREEGGQPRVLATLGEGAFFGEMALLSDAPRMASVLASAEDTQVLEISAPVLGGLAQEHPTVAQALKVFCRQRLLSNLLATAPLFRPFSRADRRELIGRFRAREVPAGQVVLQEGQPSDGLYVVLSGEVRVTVKGTPVAALREGELFGERSLLTHQPAGATVRTARHTSLLRLPREDFATLISSHPQILELVSELTDAREKANGRRGLV